MLEAIEKINKDHVKIAFVYEVGFYEPIGLCHITSFLKKHVPGIDIRFFDPNVDNIKAIKHFAPNMIMYSVMSMQFEVSKKRNSLLKKELPPFISMFGGPHAMYFPDMLLEDDIDLISVGEGEFSMLNLVNKLISKSEFKDTKGFHFKIDGKIYKNDVEPLIDDLDSYPFPDRDIIFEKLPRLGMSSKKTIYASRGCIFRCSYCHNSTRNDIYRKKGKIVRQRSPQSIVDEIHQIQKKYPLGFIEFGDEIFSGSQYEWLKEFYPIYKKVNIPYLANLRVEFVTPELVDLLKKSNCKTACIAYETANYDYRRKYLFRGMTNERLMEATKMLNSAGIKVNAPIIIGLPFTSIKDDLDSLKFACDANPLNPCTSIFQPYPGLALTKKCIESGVLKEEEVRQRSADFYSPTKIKGVEYDKVLKLHNNFAVLRYLNKWFGMDVYKAFDRIPDNFIVRSLNIFIKYVNYNRILPSKKSVWQRLKDALLALERGSFGFKLLKTKRSW